MAEDEVRLWKVKLVGNKAELVRRGNWLWLKTVKYPHWDSGDSVEVTYVMLTDDDALKLSDALRNAVEEKDDRTG